MPSDDEEMKRQALRSGHPDTQLARIQYSHENGVESTCGFWPPAIELPDAMPEPPPGLDLQEYGPGVVELISLDEQRREESKRRRAGVPFPEVLAERPPLIRYSVTGMLEVSAVTFLGFLSALDFIAPRESANQVLMSALASYDVDPNATPGLGELTLEVTNGATWAQVTMAARSQRNENFRFSLPLGMSIAIVNFLRSKYRNVVIGMDGGQICLGPYSMSFAGYLDEFPPRDPVLAGDARLAMPAAYIRRIVECLVSIQSKEPRSFLGVHLNFADRVAVATDGDRIHVLAMPNLFIEAHRSRLAPMPVTVPYHFFEFLHAVVNQEWAAMEVNEAQMTSVGEDFAISTRVAVEQFADWRPALANIDLVCLIDRELLVRYLKRAAPYHSNIDINTLPGYDYLEFTARGTGGEIYVNRERITSRVAEGNLFFNHFRVDAVQTLQAVEMCLGGVIRLGFSKTAGDPITIRGENSDFAAILMTKE